MSHDRSSLAFAAVLLGLTLTGGPGHAAGMPRAKHAAMPALIRSAHSGAWSSPSTWEGGHVPGPGARVQIRAGNHVRYDLSSSQPIRSIHVGGTLTFARDRDTRLDVGLIKIQPGQDASENGFDCDAHLHALAPAQPRPTLEAGTAAQPIPAGHTARIRLVYFPGMDKDSCPAIVCCGGRMEFHGAPMSRTWVKLGATAREGDTTVTLNEPVIGWRLGDKIILTATQRIPTGSTNGSFRPALTAGYPAKRGEASRATRPGTQPGTPPRGLGAGGYPSKMGGVRLSEASRAALEAREAALMADIAIKFAVGPARGTRGKESDTDQSPSDPAAGALAGARTALWAAENAQSHHAPGKEAAIAGVLAARAALVAAGQRTSLSPAAEAALWPARAALTTAEETLARDAPNREAVEAALAAAHAAISAAEAAGIAATPDQDATMKSQLLQIAASQRDLHPLQAYTEERTIRAIAGPTLTLDRPLTYAHLGSGDTRGEVADLSRNVIVESADPAGVRGHTMYHRGSAGSISYAEFRHLGKEGVLGRYSLHFHLVGDTMRGSSVIGASIWDSANRWLTVHGTNFLVVRDCVGYQSVGHGFYVEDGTEEYNVFDRNLAVQAFQSKPLPKQNLPFDTNDGAGFWWANSLNSFTRNVACECDGYGYRFEATPMERFDLRLPVRLPDGGVRSVDIRTLPFIRFEGNEAHSVLYGLNLGEGIDSVGPDTHHPLVVRNTRVWNAQWALRPNAPSMIVDGLTIDQCRYGLFLPIYDHHAYRALTIRQTEVPGLEANFLPTIGHRPEGLPLIDAEGPRPFSTRVAVEKRAAAEGYLPLPGEAGAKRPDAGRETKAAALSNQAAKQRFLLQGGNPLPERAPGPELASITTARFPQPLDPVDDLPPATVITSVTSPAPGTLRVRGTTSDNGTVKRVLVNGHEARPIEPNFAEWEITLDHLRPGQLKLIAAAEDAAGNREKTPHELIAAVAR